MSIAIERGSVLTEKNVGYVQQGIVRFSPSIRIYATLETFQG